MCLQWNIPGEVTHDYCRLPHIWPKEKILEICTLPSFIGIVRSCLCNYYSPFAIFYQCTREFCGSYTSFHVSRFKHDELAILWIIYVATLGFSLPTCNKIRVIPLRWAFGYSQEYSGSNVTRNPLAWMCEVVHIKTHRAQLPGSSKAGTTNMECKVAFEWTAR